MNPEVTRALVQLLVALLSLLSIVITTVAIPALRAHAGERRFQHAKGAAELAVRAIEQLYPGLTNEDKFGFALARVRELAARTGLNVTPDQWETLIEAAVKDMKAVQGAIDAPAAEPGSAAI